jgi:hypothetical protein
MNTDKLPFFSVFIVHGNSYVQNRGGISLKKNGYVKEQNGWTSLLTIMALLSIPSGFAAYAITCFYSISEQLSLDGMCMIFTEIYIGLVFGISMVVIILNHLMK